MSLQVIGNVEAGAKVVLWSETRLPIQTWSVQLSSSPICSLTFPDMLLDVKGEKDNDSLFPWLQWKHKCKARYSPSKKFLYYY